MRTLKTIDAHVGGSALRLVVEGFPAPRGQTMLDKRSWASKHADHLRRSLLLEPRGHVDMCGAVLTEPITPSAHAGVLFMDTEGFMGLSGHGIMAVATIALERGLLMPGGDGTTIVFDTAAGVVRAHAAIDGTRVERVSVCGPAAFVLQGGVLLKIRTREVRADIAFGGAFYAIVDSESAGVPIDGAHLPELRRAGADIVRAVEAVLTAVHPATPQLRGIDGAILTGPPHRPGSDLRCVSVSAAGVVARGASGTGSAAILSVLDAIGLTAVDAALVCEGIAGTQLAARITERTTVGDYNALLTEVEGSAWITGEHTFALDDADPLVDGFLLS